MEFVTYSSIDFEATFVTYRSFFERIYSVSIAFNLTTSLSYARTFHMLEQ